MQANLISPTEQPLVVLTEWKPPPPWCRAAGLSVTQDEENQTNQEQKLEAEVKERLLLMTRSVELSEKIRKKETSKLVSNLPNIIFLLAK